MKEGSNISTRFKLLMGFGVIILAIVVIVGVAYFSVIGIEKIQEHMISSFRTINTMTQLRSDENRIRALTMEMLMTKDGEERDAIQKQIMDRAAEVQKRVKSIEVAFADHPDLFNQFKTVQINMVTYLENRSYQLGLMHQNKYQEALNYAMNIQNPLYETIRLDLLDLEKKLGNHLDSVVSASSDDMHRTLYILLISGIIIVLISAWFIFGILRLLKRTSAEIKTGVNVLATSVAEILTTVTEVSTGATETATAVSETTTTIEEIRQTALLATQRAQAVVQVSNRAAGAAENGKQSVQQTIAGMKKIDHQMNLIAESVVKLSEQNRSIGEITATVNDIADQSNLLAVNAAIEAAKAGEHGRGFAVVAQEIRSLAEQSKQATSQVKEILQDIQKAVNQAVISTEQGSKAVEAGNHLAMQSGNIIDILAESVDEAVQSVIQISNSSQQQMIGMDQIVPVMENIKKASEQNAAGIKQTQSAAIGLEQLGQNLKKVVAKFNI